MAEDVDIGRNPHSVPAPGLGAISISQCARTTTCHRMRERELEKVFTHPISVSRMTACPHPRDVSPPNLSGAPRRRFFVGRRFFAVSAETQSAETPRRYSILRVITKDFREQLTPGGF